MSVPEQGGGEAGDGPVPADVRAETVRTSLAALKEGRTEGAEDLLPILYEELRSLAASYLRRERAGHTLQPTALVHEVFLRLAGDDDPEWSSRAHFLGIAARVMRQVLVDHARRKRASKRGGDWRQVTLNEDLQGTPGDAPRVDVLAVHAALDRLEELDARQARVVELRWFGGLTVAEISRILGMSERTVHTDWSMARAWLARELGREDPSDPS